MCDLGSPAIIMQIGGKLQPVHIISMATHYWLMLIFSFQSRMPRNETNLQSTGYVKNCVITLYIQTYILYSFLVQKGELVEVKKNVIKIQFLQENVHITVNKS